MAGQATTAWVAPDDPAIQYSTRPTRDAVVRLIERIEKGELQLRCDPTPRGYLDSVLKGLDIPVSAAVKAFVYQRLWEILSGRATEPICVKLSPAERRAIVEILRDTKPDLPAYFQTS